VCHGNRGRSGVTTICTGPARFYTTLFLLLTALTGSALVFHSPTQQLIATVTASEPWPPAPPTVEAEHGMETPGAASYRAVRAAASRALPEAEPMYLYFSETSEAPVTVRLRTPPE
jgi:uncharacterized iron-regulated membrane protein